MFAILKDYFPESLEIPSEKLTPEKIILELKSINPAAENILKSCRIATDEGVISNSLQSLQNSSIIYIIPPSSGG